MRSGPPLRARVLTLLGNSGMLTCVQIARLLSARLDSTSGTLRRMVRNGELTRTNGFGPRGGYGYRLASLSEILAANSMKQLSEQMDREVLEQMGAAVSYRKV